MKRLFPIGLAALLAACATQPYGDPYSQGPYGDPYPPYPAPGYPPPSTYPPPSAAPPAPMACPITSSRDWRAWINAMPGPNAQPRLMVTGTVVVPTGGYSLGFEPHLQIRESFPAQAFATMTVTPPSGPATQALTTHDLRWEWPVDQQLGSLEIRCGSDTLATFSPLTTAH